jgi:Flp pilus assembly protein TadD
MKRFLVLTLLVLALLPLSVPAQSLDDQYVQIFNLIQEADGMVGGQPSQALAKYVQAQSALERIRKGSPEWNSKVISFRLSYVASRIAAISANTPLPPSAAAKTDSAQSAADIEAQWRKLQTEVRQLQADKIVLETKLKEALTLQPAEADPRELNKANERIKALEKETELLRAAVAAAKAAPKPSLDAANLEQAQKESEALRAENQLLKKQLADRPAAAPSGKDAKAKQELAKLEAQIATLQSDKENLRLEKTALENRLKQMSAAPSTPTPAPAAVAEDASRIKKLERERDDLQRKLAAAQQKASKKNKGKSDSAQVQTLENQLVAARQRLEILEARAVPYTPEELALMKRPETRLAEVDSKAGKKPSKDLPPNSSKLVAEAQVAFAAKKFDQAEAAYVQVLQQDQKNVPALANLAAIQVEAKRYDQAENSLKQALAQDPEDPYSLYVLGLLKFQQARYDDALDALSRAAKLDPQNANVQNYLGLALSEKGLRGPAETALRKALQLQPGNASAHYNLAIVYLSQVPPAAELARWHYQKAITAGHPRSADVEKKFEGR